MIEFAVGPNGDGVASGAGRGSGWEIGSDVIGDVAAKGLRLIPVRSVAGEAIRGIQRIVVVDVAIGAGRSLVRAD